MVVAHTENHGLLVRASGSYQAVEEILRNRLNARGNLDRLLEVLGLVVGLIVFGELDRLAGIGINQASLANILAVEAGLSLVGRFACEKDVPPVARLNRVIVGGRGSLPPHPPERFHRRDSPPPVGAPANP